MHSRDVMLLRKNISRNYYYCDQDENSLGLCFKSMYLTLIVAIFTSNFIFSMFKSFHTCRNINISNLTMRHLPNICCTQWPFGHLIVDDFGSKTYITQLYYSSEFVSKYHHQHEILKLIALTTVVFVHAFNLVTAKIALNTKLQPIKTIGGRWYFFTRQW